MRLSVIISTYNQPLWLEKVIWGYAVQTHRDFELVVADDGSAEETGHMIDRLRRESGLTIRHVWHEDRGFRKCAILNRAIVEAAAEYLVFTDGDCIPRRDFLSQHRRLAEQGRFLSGGALRLPVDISRQISKDDITAGRATNVAWLRTLGLPWHRKQLKLLVGARLGTLVDWISTTRPTWNGGNSSTWKADLLRVNGFDERMEYGGEDRELGERLINSGLRGKSIRYRAVCVHLDHSRGYVHQKAIERNLEIRRQTHAMRKVWTQFGIVKQPQPVEVCSGLIGVASFLQALRLTAATNASSRASSACWPLRNSSSTWTAHRGMLPAAATFNFTRSLWVHTRASARCESPHRASSFNSARV